MPKGKQPLLTSNNVHCCTASVVFPTPGNTSNPHHVAAGISTITAMSHTATSSVYSVYSSVLMQAEAPEAGHHISHAGRAEVQHLL